MRRVRRWSAALLYVWAGFTHVATLLTIVALFYFPVYLDSHARRAPAARLAWPGPFLACAAGLLYGLLRRPGTGARWPAPRLVTPATAAVGLLRCTIRAM